MFKDLRREIESAMARDPAARSWIEVVLCYPGFQAMLIYRLSNALWRRQFFLLGRLVSHIGRFLTGIEIHPGARIGRRVFIDHGMGVVIGETSEIDDGVTLYHGVTLGGVAPSVDSDSQRGAKRHPTLEAGVTVGSGAQILGPVTVGSGAKIGANAVVTHDVPAGATIVGIPGRQIHTESEQIGDSQINATRERPFTPYGTPQGEFQDPITKTLEGLLSEVQSLRNRVKDLETVQAASEGEVSQTSGSSEVILATPAADAPRPDDQGVNAGKVTRL